MDPIGIYIHIPFCLKKCPYCSFYSVKANNNLMDDYTESVCCRIKDFGKKINKEANTLYFGGGTPSVLGTKRLLKILNSVKKSFTLKDPETTMEINPSSKDLIDLKELYLNGINRLSVGLQSANDNELSLLGRLHTKNTAKKTVEEAFKAGFKNISLDLMLAIQEQTEESLFNSIKFCSDLNVQHISAYILSIEKGTTYYKEKDKLKLKKEDEQSRLYLFTCKTLENFGFYQYEISNFSKKGFESKHNLKYWKTKEYIGIGPSAHSFINKKRFYYKNSIEDFLKGKPCVLDGKGGYEEEYALLRLRLSEGLINEKYFNRFKKNIPNDYFKRAKLYEPYGLLKIKENESIKLTQKGFLVSNKLISDIIN